MSFKTKWDVIKYIGKHNTYIVGDIINDISEEEMKSKYEIGNVIDLGIVKGKICRIRHFPLSTPPQALIEYRLLCKVKLIKKEE